MKVLTCSSVIVYCLFHPPTEMAIAANHRVLSEKVICDFAASGCVPNRDELMTIHDTVTNWPDAIREFELYEDLTDGLYTRELHMPKNNIIVGKIHKYPYFVSILKGKCRLLSEHYNKVVEAPTTFTLPAGIKHIVFNIEDTVWSDVHTGDWKSIEDAASDIFAASYDDLDKHLHIVEAG